MIYDSDFQLGDLTCAKCYAEHQKAEPPIETLPLVRENYRARCPHCAKVFDIEQGIRREI